MGKVPTTREDRSKRFFGSIDEAAGRLGLSAEPMFADTEKIVHGTTGTNAIVARTASKVGLLATAGHGDVLFIMKGSRAPGGGAEVLMDLVAHGGQAGHHG